MTFIKYNLKPIQKLVLTALLIALAIVINFFKIDIPIAGGAPALRISFGTPPLAFIAIIGGPLYGGVSGGIIDVLGYIIKPTGAYIPLLTVTAILKGALLGLLWKIVASINIKTFIKIYILFFSLMGILGMVNLLSLNLLPESKLSLFISSIGSKSSYTTSGLILVFVLGILLLYIIKIFADKLDTVFEKYVISLTAIGCASIIITTINTYVLKLFMSGLSTKSFMIIWIPRIIESLIMIPIETYALLSIIGVYNKFMQRKTI